MLELYYLIVFQVLPCYFKKSTREKRMADDFMRARRVVTGKTVVFFNGRMKR